MLVDLDAKGENMDIIDSIRGKSEHARASHQELLTMIPYKNHSFSLFDHAWICDSWCLHIIQFKTRLRQKSKFSKVFKKENKVYNCCLVPLRIRLPASNLFLLLTCLLIWLHCHILRARLVLKFEKVLWKP